jgi:transposase-like protein
MPLTQGLGTDTLFLDGLLIHPHNVPLNTPEHLRVEYVPCKLICGHVLGLFLNVLSHGASMREKMDLCKLIEQFGDDDKCRSAIENMRWPDGVRCPACKSAKISRIVARKQFDCDSCRYQFSATAGTIFHDTHLPLHKWFLATYLLCESKKGMPALQMQRMLKTTYRTSWYLCHRIREAMKEVHESKLDGTIEIDETYIYGKPRRGRRNPKKQIVIGIRKRNGDLRLVHAADLKKETIREIIAENVGSHVQVIMTDESTIYPWAMSEMHKTRHQTIQHKREYVTGDVHTNTVESSFSLLKRGIVGTWHKVSAKHLHSYLNEMCFRFNNRKNPYLFRDTILKLIGSPNLEYKDLIAKVQDVA